MGHTQNAQNVVNPLGGNADTSFSHQLRVSRVDLDYTQDGTAQTIGTIDAGVVIHSVRVYTSTAFDDSTTVTVTVGVDGDPDAIEAGINAKSAGLVSGTLDGASPFVTAEDVAVATVTLGTGDATAGACTVFVTWFAPEPS